MRKPKVLRHVRDGIDSLFSPLVERGAGLGINANHITFLQLPFLFLMLVSLLDRMFVHAGGYLLVALILDLLDGSWARVSGEENGRGHLYDKVVDLIGIYAFLGGVWIAVPETAYLAATLALLNALLYISNHYFDPDLYCGVRAFGMVGLVTSLDLLLGTSAAIGSLMLLSRPVTALRRR